MCIRDRVLALGRIQQAHAPRRPGVEIHRAGVELAEELLGAVSYTHLRAHETVLAIVCRLLLEKKTL